MPAAPPIPAFMTRASNGAFLARGGTFELMATNAELALRDPHSTVDDVLRLRDLVETFRHELKFANPSLRLAVVGFVERHLNELLRIATWVIDDDEGDGAEERNEDDEARRDRGGSAHTATARRARSSLRCICRGRRGAAHSRRRRPRRCRRRRPRRRF